MKGKGVLLRVFLFNPFCFFILSRSISKTFANSETFFGMQLLSLQSFFEGKIFITKSQSAIDLRADVLSGSGNIFL